MTLHLRLLGAAIASIAISLTALAGPADAYPGPPPSHRTVKIAHAMRVVMNQQGDPYVYGADGPTAFDCSGLVEYSYGQAGLYLPRTADDQYRYTRHVRLRNMVRGDFVYYHDSSGHVFHTAVFAGRVRGQSWVWEAAHTGTNVNLNQIWDAPRYGGTLRIRPGR